MPRRYAEVLQLLDQRKQIDDELRNFIRNVWASWPHCKLDRLLDSRDALEPQIRQKLEDLWKARGDA